MARRLWLTTATLLILPVLAFGYGRLGGFGRSHDAPIGPFPEPGLIEAGMQTEDDVFVCSVCVAEGRPPETRRDESRSHVHEGRRYHLCSGGCLEQFKKNPAYFLAALAERWRGPEESTEPEEEI